jgi:tRNA(fMet)-specific endonuclease VapC
VVITVISLEEQLSGWYRLLRQVTQPDDLARTYQNLIATVQFLARLPILPFQPAAIARCKQLIGMKLNVGRMDLRIAAIALEHGGIVVTRNKRDFARVPGLIVEDWSA